MSVGSSPPTPPPSPTILYRNYMEQAKMVVTSGVLHESNCGVDEKKSVTTRRIGATHDETMSEVDYTNHEIVPSWSLLRTQYTTEKNFTKTSDDSNDHLYIIGRNGYCSWDIYLQLVKASRSVISLIVFQKCWTGVFFIGWHERAAVLFIVELNS